MSNIAEITRTLATVATAANELQEAVDSFWAVKSEAEKLGIHVSVRLTGKAIRGKLDFDVAYQPRQSG